MGVEVCGEVLEFFMNNIDIEGLVCIGIKDGWERWEDEVIEEEIDIGDCERVIFVVISWVGVSFCIFWFYWEKIIVCEENGVIFSGNSSNIKYRDGDSLFGDWRFGKVVKLVVKLRYICICIVYVEFD